MAMDEALAGHVRAALSGTRAVQEVKMFGGLGFMLNGNMVAACSDRGLLVRLGEAATAEAIERGAEPMVMNGRTMKAYIRVTDTGDASAVASWVHRARDFVQTLPPKTEAPRRKRKANKR